MLGETIRRRRKLDPAPALPRRSTPGLRWSRWIPAGLGAVLLSFGIGYAIAVWAIFPAPDVAAENATPLPRLTGRELTQVQSEIEALGLTVGGVMWLPHPMEPAGHVIAQDPLPGQQLRQGGEVRLAVSSGRAQAKVPDVVGLPYSTAEQLARRLGFEVNRVIEMNPGPAGLVVRVMPQPGTERVLPTAITLVVSEPPPEPVQVDVDRIELEADPFSIPTPRGVTGAPAPTGRSR